MLSRCLLFLKPRAATQTVVTFFFLPLTFLPLPHPLPLPHKVYKCIFSKNFGEFLHFSKRKEKCCWLLIHFIFRGPKIILCHQWEQGGILIYEYFIGICVGPFTVFLRGQITIKVCPQLGGGMEDGGVINCKWTLV